MVITLSIHQIYGSTAEECDPSANKRLVHLRSAQPNNRILQAQLLDDAASPITFTGRQERCSSRRLKYIIHTLPGERRTFQIFASTDLGSHVSALFGRQKLLRSLPHLLDSHRILSKVLLQPNQQYRDVWTSFRRLLDPLLRSSVGSVVAINGETFEAYLVSDILERVRDVDGETDENDVCLGVGQRAQSFVILLPSCVPQRQLHGSAVNSTVCNIVLEDGGNIMLRKVMSQPQRIPLVRPIG